MADQGSIANLKQNINENIYDNTDYDITGGRMNTVLQNIVDTLEFNGRDFFNVNEYNEQETAYSDAAIARADVPDEVKKLGLVITYLLADGWYIDQFIGSDISGWGTASNWKVLGPVRVSQNTSTGYTDITIGDETTSVASVQDDYILKNEVIPTDLDISPVISGRINSGKWNDNSSYAFKLVRVYGGQVIDITPTPSKIIRYCVLKSFDGLVNNETPDFATGFSDTIDSASTSTMRITIPNDGVFLYLMYSYDSDIFYPLNIADANKLSYTLKNNYEKLSREVAPTDFTPNIGYNGYIGSNGLYYFNNTYKMYVFKVTPNHSIRITANAERFTRYALLKSFGIFQNAIEPDLCSGTEQEYRIEAGESQTIQLPNDCNYLLVYKNISSTTNDYFPSEIVDLSNLETRVANIEANMELNPSLMLSKTENEIDIYKKRSNGSYIKYPIIHYQSPFVQNEYPSFFDCWDLDIVKLCHKSGESIIEDYNLFRSGLAECAISLQRGDSAEPENVFVGGGENGHGFENIIVNNGKRNITILIDNQKITENAIIPLKEIKSFSIIQNTQLYQAYTNSNPFAELTREWTFNQDGVILNARIKYLRAISIKNSYIGMMCVLRHQDADNSKPYITKYGIQNNSPFYVWDFSSIAYVPKSTSITKFIEYGELGIGFSQEVVDSNRLDSGGMFVSDNGDEYNKIYFAVGSDYTPTLNQLLNAKILWAIE